MAAKIYMLLYFIVLCKCIDINSLKMEQVLILSRHNVRTPLTGDLEQYSDKPWPKWSEPAGHLTHKGTTLEGYMGKYIAEWLKSEDFIDGCPKEEEVHIYANTKPRTIASAKAFVESAFRYCNFSVYHHDNVSIFDPIFFPVFHNKAASFKNKVTEEMVNKLKEVNLTEAYLELGRIINIENSEICRKFFLCDLTLVDNAIVNEENEEPNVSGPLFIGNSIVDSFIMSFYEGKPIKDVAWGEISSDEQWQLLSKISAENQNVRFNLTSGSKDLAGPLLKYMFDIFEYGTPKFTLLMGHDSNLNPVLRALDVKPFKLPDTFEPFPIGGKLVFQKWVDNTNQYLKLEYFYPTSLQLRFGKRLSMHQPPQRVILKLKGCKTTANGYCPWKDFMKLNSYQ